MDFKIPDGTPNDSDLSVREVEGLMAREGVPLSYGDVQLMVQRSALEDVRAYVRGLDQDERAYAMASVDRALRKAAPKILRGKIKRRRMDDFHADLLLWTALREVAAQ